MPRAASSSSKSATSRLPRKGRHHDPEDPGDRLYGRLWELEGYVQEHWPKFAALAGAVLLIASIGIGIRQYRESQTRAAAEALSQASAHTDNAERLEALVAVAEEYPQTASGVQAAFEAAELAFDQGDYDQARALFDSAAAAWADALLAPAGLIGAASALEAAGQTAEAKGLYQQVLEAHASSYVRPQAHLALGRLAEAENDSAAALEHYRAIVDGSSGSVWAQQARERIELLAPESVAEESPLPTAPFSVP